LYLQQRLQILLQALRFVLWRVPLHDVALSVDQEFGEVPFDGFAPEQPPLLGLEEFIERVRVVAVDLDLGEQGEADIVVQ
jgi:hypothetical protein